MLKELMPLADKIKRLRNDNNITQAELAGKLNITRSAVNSWEMGSSIPSTEMIVKLARLFSVSTDYLLGVDNIETISVEGLSSSEVESIAQVISCFRNKKK